ncbi:hypothetical protein Hanom_Chr08g00726941 [Helianthus anomalus]
MSSNHMEKTKTRLYYYATGKSENILLSALNAMAIRSTSTIFFEANILKFTLIPCCLISFTASRPSLDVSLTP